MCYLDKEGNRTILCWELPVELFTPEQLEELEFHIEHLLSLPFE